MKWTAILLVALLLVGVPWLAAGPTRAQSSGPGPVPYAVTGSTVAGGGYQLSSLAWHITGAASGGTYHLSMVNTPALRGSGCCCTYLPCILRNGP